jgi:H+-translocating NAD(P) transhydrogenase subunit alpha
MSTVTVGAVRETAPGEHRVALVPEVVTRLRHQGWEVLVEAGAGNGASFSDEAYADAGATVVTADELDQRADVVVCVAPPDGTRPLRPGQLLVGLLGARQDPAAVARWAADGVTAVSLDLLPRTLSRAQSMDALTSQATIAGYKAVLVAAGAYGRYFPMLTTAAGTVKPARVLVLGAGVAGLSAIGTARRLGALVTGYDVRPEARGDVRSLGARFLDLTPASGPDPVVAGAGEGGYARALTPAEQRAQQQALDTAIADFDVVITTAQVPGRRPPVLVTTEAVKAMRPGSVIVDLAAGPLGGNVEGAVPDRSTVVAGAVTVIGAGNLPATMPAAASTAYARNIAALLGHLADGTGIHLDLDDEVTAAVVVTHAGRVVNPAIAALVAEPATSGGPS